ncbi:hypothetical protein ACFYU9_16025 [Streptomyces sp. NPDC004327]|uniref:hypothetical protein n=1 Tax=unclassified Streptomyces TaxID=2593676 RepID=UPI00367EA620
MSPAQQNQQVQQTPETAGGRAARWTGPVLIGLGLALIPWVVYLHVGMPATAQEARWAWTWTGLDALEALALIGTGRLLMRRDPRASLTATAVTALLVVDAWFDTMTASSGEDLVWAIVLAVVAELPLAVVCARLAWRGFPHVRYAAGGHALVQGAVSVRIS